MLSGTLKLPQLCLKNALCASLVPTGLSKGRVLSPSRARWFIQRASPVPASRLWFIQQASPVPVSCPLVYPKVVSCSSLVPAGLPKGRVLSLSCARWFIQRTSPVPASCPLVCPRTCQPHGCRMLVSGDLPGLFLNDHSLSDPQMSMKSSKVKG